MERIEMKLYHGTSERKARCIENEGFLGSEISDFTMLNRHVENGVVYMAATMEEAAEYGNVVFEIDTLGNVEVFPFSDGNTQHFYAYADAINAEAIYERI
jgi:hypothetical protein